MKRYKRFLSALLACCMMMGLFPTTALATDAESDIAYAVTGGNIYFDATTGTITDCDESVTEADIPDTIQGVKVEYIGDGAFIYCSQLVVVTIPSTVSTIGMSAFSYCLKLSDLNIESGVSTIDSYAFQHCDNLVNLIIPGSVESIGNRAFFSCDNLKSVFLQEGVKEIGNEAFANCQNLNHVKLPNSFSVLEGMPLSELHTFSGCTKLISAGPAGGNYNIELGWTETIPDYGLFGFPYLTSLVIPDGVTSIGEGAIVGNLSKLILPESLTNISSNAFYGDSSKNLQTAGPIGGNYDIEYAHDEEISFFFSCFEYLEKLIIPASISSIISYPSLNALDHKNLVNAGPLGSECDIEFGWIHHIPAAAFSNSEIKSVIIPESVTSIGDRAFYQCQSMEKVTISENITEIGKSAFAGCTSLESIDIPKGISTLNNGTFSGCTQLSYVKLPDAITEIGSSVFYGTSLTSICLPETITTIGSSAFPDTITDVYYAASQEKWDAIVENYLYIGLSESTTIHYNSTGPEVPEPVIGSVKLFSKWDPRTCQVYFDSSHLAYTVSSLVDTSSIDQLVGKYVLVETDETNIFEVTSIKPVESKVGAVLSTGENLISFEPGVFLPVSPDLILSAYEDKTVLYHIYENTVVGLESLKENTGTLDAWDSSTGKVTIGGTEYPTNYLTDLTFLANLDQILGKQVSFYVTPSEGYACVMKIDSYQTKTGVFSHYDPIADVAYIGEYEYPVDSSVCYPDTNLLKDKNVFFLLKSGSIIDIGAFDSLTAELSLILRPLAFAVNYRNGTFDQNSVELTAIASNSIADSLSNWYDLSVIYADPNFQASVEPITLAGATWESTDSSQFIEDGSYSTQNTVLNIGDSFSQTVHIALNTRYIPKAATESIISNFTLSATQNGQTVTSQERIVVEINNHDYVEPGDDTTEDDVPSDSDMDTLTENASQELSKVDSIISLNMDTMDKVFGIKGKALTRLEQEILSVIVMSNAPQQRFEDQVSEGMLKKTFGNFKPNISAVAYDIPLQYVIQTPKYGQVTVQFNCDMTNFLYVGAQLGLYGTIGYEILNSENEIPEVLQESSVLGQIVQADVSAFASAAYDVAEAEIKRAYDMVWGGPANELADLLFEQTVKDILDRHNTTFKDEVWELITWPTKNVINECPTNVYIYDETGTLCGAIENNIVTKSIGDFVLLVEGSTKYINDLEDRYTVKYVATDNGTMDVVVTEYIGYETPLRQVAHYEIPLGAGGYYTQNISGDMQPPIKEYQLVSDSEVIFAVDEESKLLELKPAEEQESETPDNPPVPPSTPGQSGSSSSSGGGSSIPGYVITVEDADHGSVSVSSSRADKGETVTITVDPDAGYELGTLVVTDGRGDRVDVERQSGTRYTFEMPSSRVTVEATFVEISEEPDALPFVDVPTGAYYYNAVRWAVDNDIANGTGATSFGPDESCTRAQVITFLWRAAGCPAPVSTDMVFTDVSTDSYYYDAVLWAIGNNITKGTDTFTFSPNETVTRGQIVTFLWRAAGCPEPTTITIPFIDVPVSAYYFDAVLWAVENNITTGISATAFAPQRNCIRAETVTFLYRAC